jgi:hypothetical protein
MNGRDKHEADGHLDFRGSGVNRHACGLTGHDRDDDDDHGDE